MTWDWTIKLADIAIILATGLGPILAVQVQKIFEKRRATEGRRLQIFRMLMATRATRLSPAHVEALNAIPVEFYGNSQALRQIQDDWKSYLDTLANKDLTGQVIAEKRNNAFIDMLYSMSRFIGYSFSKSAIENDVYRPEGHVIIETDQEIIRRGLAKILSGETMIPMAVKEFPVDATALENQLKLQKLLSEWLGGERAVKVEQE
jgi:hypothetical protein